MAEASIQPEQEETEEAYVLEEVSFSEMSSQDQFQYESVKAETEQQSEEEVLDYETLTRKDQDL